MQVEVFFTIPDAFGTHHRPVLLNASASVEVYYQFLSLAVQKGNSSITPLQVCEVLYQFFEFGCSKRKQFYCAAYKS